MHLEEQPGAAALLPQLASCGVTGLEGISGPPQSDATLDEARKLCGPGLTLWGGISQDVLLSTAEQSAFQEMLAAAVEAAGRPRMILGVADRVPPEALPERLEAVGRATL